MMTSSWSSEENPKLVFSAFRVTLWLCCHTHLHLSYSPLLPSSHVKGGTPLPAYDSYHHLCSDFLTALSFPGTLVSLSFLLYFQMFLPCRFFLMSMNILESFPSEKKPRLSWPSSFPQFSSNLWSSFPHMYCTVFSYFWSGFPLHHLAHI